MLIAAAHENEKMALNIVIPATHARMPSRNPAVRSAYCIGYTSVLVGAVVFTVTVSSAGYKSVHLMRHKCPSHT